MKGFHIFICLSLTALLLWLDRTFVPDDVAMIGGLTWVGWVSIAMVTVVVGVIVMFNDSARAFGFFKTRDEKAATETKVRTLTRAELAELGIEKYRGPEYPHPVIFPERCIGCQACVDACPHDVLAIVDGTAAAVAPDLCMEDTACQAECPVNPKACIIINTAKEVRSLPTPTRDGATYETNVAGCYIIGDVSGVPLIKNAVKEGAEVIEHIRARLAPVQPEPKAEYDVAIIGIGPGGASAAAAAQDFGLKYIAIEQNNTLSTIDLYPKGKYIFFKPDAKDWVGGIPAVGLGLAKPKYGSSTSTDDSMIALELGADLDRILERETPRLHQKLMEQIPRSLRDELSPKLSEKIRIELTRRVGAVLKAKGNGDWPQVFRTHFLPEADRLLSEMSAGITDQLRTKVPGDQRENILAVWLGSLAERGVRINEFESCKAVTKAGDGDYFIVATERGNEKLPQSYRARRVVLSIGLRGAPNRLRLPNEDMKFSIEGREEQKVIYGLSNPMDFRGRRIVVVGGGNVAVEAAVDLVAVRDGAAISPRKPEDMNKVTMLVRDFLAPTVKFGNKLHLYSCAEQGLIDLRFGAGIRELREHEVVIEEVATKREVETIANDYVFALIGGERPNRFLESIGITIE
jgi:thioredoxin reductase/Pyruvate/2-oxoacid:ferredoxin oxidoreductase delta subunit